MKRTELKRGGGPLKRGKGLARGEKQLTRKRAKARSRKDTIPAKVRRLVWQRGRECARCWATWGLDLHHRRIKGIGGDPRPHTDCACNLIALCRACHDWAHGKGRLEAEATGYIVPRGELAPGSVSVLIGAGSGSGALSYLTCDKPYYTAAEPPSEVAA